MEKPSEYRNCSLCAKRRDCWNTERYGDFGEKGKRPFPRDGVCSAFSTDNKRKDWTSR